MTKRSINGVRGPSKHGRRTHAIAYTGGRVCQQDNNIKWDWSGITNPDFYVFQYVDCKNCLRIFEKQTNPPSVEKKDD